MNIEVHRRPSGPVAEEVLSVVKDLTGEWFTEDVAPAARRDLLFQDALCVRENGRIRAFLMFTSHDGAIHITLMGTSLEYRGRGFGSALIEFLVSHAKELGFCEIVTFTVPPEAKPAYQATVDFYKNRGFKVVTKHTDLWQGGAIELRMLLKR